MFPYDNTFSPVSKLSDFLHILSMANKLKYGNQKARCWFFIRPNRIRMLMIKWMDRVASSCMRGIFSFGVDLLGLSFLVPGVPKLSDTGALGLLVVTIVHQAGYGVLGVEIAGEVVRGSGLG